mgnify:CR=1 FL=1
MSIHVKQVAIDTGVWVESILIGSQYYALARTIRGLVERGRILALITPLTATEVMYVSYRAYREIGLDGSEALERAERFFDLLYTLRNIRIIINSQIAREAASLKMRYNLALSDCYLLATAKLHNSPALFRHVEREMEGCVDELRREVQIYFLSEF